MLLPTYTQSRIPRIPKKRLIQNVRNSDDHTMHNMHPVLYKTHLSVPGLPWFHCKATVFSPFFCCILFVQDSHHGPSDRLARSKFRWQEFHVPPSSECPRCRGFQRMKAVLFFYVGFLSLIFTLADEKLPEQAITDYHGVSGTALETEVERDSNFP